MTTQSPQFRWLWLSGGIIVCDQVTKQLAEALLVPHQPVGVLPFFDWYLTYNTGAAFSFLADAGGWQRWLFTGLALVISAIIVQWLRTLPREETLTALALALILGGAIGNLIDRIRLGYVTDFIQVWFGSWAFPSFNVADSAISVGAALLIIDALFFSGRTANAGADRPD